MSRYLIVIFAISTTVTAADMPMGTHITTRSAVVQTAPAQLAYARRLSTLAATTTSDQHVVAVLQAYNAYEVVPVRWPKDSAMVCTARLEQSLLFLHENLFQNAIDTADRGLMNCSSPLLHRVKGIALRRLGKRSEAEEALKTARGAEGFARLAATEKLIVVNELATFYEHARNDREAIKYLREAAQYADPLTQIAMLMRSADANERLHDVSGEREDLTAVDAALSRARGVSLSEGELAALRVFDDDIARKHTSVGSH